VDDTGVNIGLFNVRDSTEYVGKLLEVDKFFATQ
jgi:hypothetical protein